MIKGALIDLSGTVHIGDAPIPGAVEAVRRLRREGVPFRFVTNTSRKTRKMLHEDIVRMGFDVPRGAHLHGAAGSAALPGAAPAAPLPPGASEPPSRVRRPAAVRS